MSFNPKYIELSKMSDSQVSEVLKECKVGLTVIEARKVEEMIGRGPTETELIMFGIQGSEHCSYRSSRDHLKKLPTKGGFVMVGVGEDSGIVELTQDKKGRKYGVVLAHESHNHPSQIVPYEGAATGVGGVIRDIVCMGAEAIASMDPLRFGNIGNNQTRWLYDNVVSGISGYGNPLGVCNIGGDVNFDDSFSDNCLVNVVGVGFLREDEIIHSRAPKEAAKEGYDLILVGKPTDNSGMGGASFASLELKEEDTEANKGAVQEPNPFLEQHILESTYELFRILKEKKELHRVGFKDLGAGGVMCSTVELAFSGGFGAEVDLEKVHTSMEINPSVIACAETQERFVWTCHPSLTEMILDHYNNKWALPKVSKGARASNIGKVKSHDRYIARYKGDVYCDVKAADLTSGLKYDRKYKEPKRESEAVLIETPSLSRLKELILHVLAHENVCSRRPIYDRYDKHVQALTVLESGKADAGVMAPLWGRNDEDIENIKDVGFSLTVDSNPRMSKLSPYWGSYNAVAESVRNTACVGGYPVALTDCLNYGNPEKEGQMWEFVQGIEGLKDAATQITIIKKDEQIPYVSGNVSFYNQSKDRSVAPSAVICCMGHVEDVKKSPTMEFKQEGSKIYLLGQRKNELGGSVFYDLHGQLGTPDEVPKTDAKELKKQVKVIVPQIMKGNILAAHDISEGGLVTTISEMIIGGNGCGKKSANIDLTVLNNDLPLWVNLFSETPGFVVEVDGAKEKDFLKMVNEEGIEAFSIGEVTSDEDVIIWQIKEKLILSKEEMRDKWLNGLNNKLSK